MASYNYIRARYAADFIRRVSEFGIRMADGAGEESLRFSNRWRWLFFFFIWNTMACVTSTSVNATHYLDPAGAGMRSREISHRLE